MAAVLYRTIPPLLCLSLPSSFNPQKLRWFDPDPAARVTRQGGIPVLGGQRLRRLRRPGVGVTCHPRMGADHCLVVVRLRAIWLWLSLGVGTAPVDSREAGLAVFNLTV